MKKIVNKIVVEGFEINLYLFNDCIRHCGSTAYPYVYRIEDDGTLVKTDYLFFDRIRVTRGVEFSHGIVDTRLMSIEGYAIEKTLNRDGTYSNLIDGIPFEIFAYNGWSNERDKIFADKGFMHFINRRIPSSIDLSAYTDKQSDNNEESVCFIKYQGYIGVTTPEHIYWEKEYFCDDIPISQEEKEWEIKTLYNVLRILRERRLIGGTDRRFGYVDKTSFVDLEVAEKAYCFGEITEIVNTEADSLNLFQLGKRLGLAKDTACQLNLRIRKEPNDNKSKGKMLFYKIAYGYMVSTLLRFSSLDKIGTGGDK